MYVYIFVLYSLEASSQTSTNDYDLPSIKVVAPIGKSTNVTKGFDVQQRDGFKNITPRSQSPASRCDSPTADKSDSSAQTTSAQSSAELSQKSRDIKANALAQYEKERSDSKQHLYMVVIGHVDAGKSTLMGHLLCALGQVCVLG